MQRLDLFKMPAKLRGKNKLFVNFGGLFNPVCLDCHLQFAYGWRRFLLRLFGADIGVGVLIRPTARITYPWKLTVGDYSHGLVIKCGYTI